MKLFKTKNEEAKKKSEDNFALYEHRLGMGPFLFLWYGGT